MKNYIGRNEDEWEYLQQKKAKREKYKLSKICPECNKRVKNLDGLKQHLRDVHNLKLAPPKPEKFETVPYIRN